MSYTDKRRLHDWYTVEISAWKLCSHLCRVGYFRWTTSTPSRCSTLRVWRTRIYWRCWSQLYNLAQFTSKIAWYVSPLSSSLLSHFICSYKFYSNCFRFSTASSEPSSVRCVWTPSTCSFRSNSTPHIAAMVAARYLTWNATWKRRRRTTIIDAQNARESRKKGRTWSFLIVWMFSHFYRIRQLQRSTSSASDKCDSE